MVVKVYAQILGVVLLLVGIVGLLLGDRLLLGILNIDIFEDIVHLLTVGADRRCVSRAAKAASTRPSLVYRDEATARGALAA